MSGKFYQVVQQTGPFGDRRDRHLGFSKHEAEARVLSERQRQSWRDGDIVVYSCRFGPTPYREEVLRLPASRFERHPSNRCGAREPVAGELICNRTVAHDGDHESWGGPEGPRLAAWRRPNLDARTNMNFVTYVERDLYPGRAWFCVVIATGPNTKPTPDGGPWATEYEVPHCDRGRLREVSENAERMLFQMLRAHAPEVYARAVELGWDRER